MNEIVQFQHERPLDAYRMSTDAAGVCRDIVVATASTIQGRKFVSVEGWQAIALAHGCVAGSRDVERVDGGIRAIGEVRRMSDGGLIATAEGFVGEDETTWFGGKDKRGRVHDKRPDYAIRAMAQTRAISRACRSAFAHVVVMMKAGLATTPAEEMVTFDAETGEVVEAAPVREKVPGITKIKERLSQLRKEGDAATELDAFNALIKDHKDDLKTIRDANHEWWTGDGEDFEGFGAWKERRKAELSRVDSATFQFLASVVQECKTIGELQSLVDEHADKIAELDGDESRRFDLAYNNREAELESRKPRAVPTPMTEGAFGG